MLSSEREDYSSDTIDAVERGEWEETLSRRTAPAFPAPLAPAAFQGLAGEFVTTLAPETEAHPAGLLVQLLTVAGSLIGRAPFYLAEGAQHFPNLYCVLVGSTSKGRKGSSWTWIRRLATDIDPVWHTRSGAVSGEGLIFAVRDARGEDPGVTDKRLLVQEPEFASVLKAAAREGSTLATWLRCAWDNGHLETLAKQQPCVATAAHISMVGHVTRAEVRRYMSATEHASGTGNRILWTAVERANKLPRGGRFALHPDALDEWRASIQHASYEGELRFTHAAGELWDSEYDRLSSARPGMLGHVASRAEAQVVRLSLIYALLDRARAIDLPHLRAGLAVWDYCERSALWVFGDCTGEPLADDLLARLREAEGIGLTKTDLHNATGRNARAHAMNQALELLADGGLARRQFDFSSGRPVERWLAITNYESTNGTNR